MRAFETPDLEAPMVRSRSGLIALLLAAICGAVACDQGPTAPSPQPSAPTAAGGIASRPNILTLTVTDIKRDVATLEWTTDQPTDEFAEFDTSPAFTTPQARHISNSQLRTAHSYRLFGLLPGSTHYVRVRATNSAGLTTTSAIIMFDTLPAPEGPIVASLTVTSFRMIEVQYPGYPGWYYAPEIEVRETSGLANAIVTRIAVSVPGVLGAPAYQTSKCVGAGTQMLLFREVYGDFELTIDSPGTRSPGGSGTAEITFEDAFGRQGKVTATGPVVAGGFPTTYSNPPTSWGCSIPAAR